MLVELEELSLTLIVGLGLLSGTMIMFRLHLIGRLIAEDPDYFDSWKIEWIIGNSRLRTPKFEWEKDLEVINESR